VTFVTLSTVTAGVFEAVTVAVLAALTLLGTCREVDGFAQVAKVGAGGVHTHS